MKRALKLCTLALGLATLTAAAKADPVSGKISINGFDTYNATSITFNGNGNTSAFVATGTFSNLFTPTNQTATVQLNSFNFDGGFVNPTQVFTITNNGVTVTLNLTGITSHNLDGNGNLEVMGVGTLSETGFTTSAGTFDLTTQGGTGGVTFSATSVAPTPEPSSLLLLGTGLLGSAGAFFRRRQTAA